MNRKFNTMKSQFNISGIFLNFFLPARDFSIYLGTFEISNMGEYSCYIQYIENQFSHLRPKYGFCFLSLQEKTFFKIGFFCILLKFLQEITLCMLTEQLCNVKQTAGP